MDSACIVAKMPSSLIPVVQIMMYLFFLFHSLSTAKYVKLDREVDKYKITQKYSRNVGFEWES